MDFVDWLRRLAAAARGRAEAEAHDRGNFAAEPRYRLRRLEDRCVLNADVAGLNLFTIAENSSAGTTVGQVVVTSTDQGPPTAFAITDGNDDGAFSIDAAGRLSVADGHGLDFESLSTHNLVVTATFGGAGSAATAPVDVAVNLTDVFAPATINLPSGGDATLSLVDGHLQVSHGGATLFDQPFEDVSQLTIVGSDQDDRLLVDFAAGNPLPAGGLTFDGAGQTTADGDALEIIGGSFSSMTSRHDNGHDGAITLTTAGVERTITYRNLEPLVNTGTVADLEFTLSGVNDNAVLEDLGGGLLRLRSTDAVPTFESTTFAAPTNSLTIHGGDGNDFITIGALGGGFTLNVEGDLGTNTLIVDTLEPAPTSPTFRFAGFTFDQNGTPNLLTPLTGGLIPDGDGAVIHTSAGSTEAAGFPESAVGFDPTLSIGRLIYPALTTGTLALNLPSNNSGATLRAGFELRWSGNRTLTNASGNDLVIYEASSNPNGPDAAMVQVHIVGGGWTQWRYEAPDARADYTTGGPTGAFATAFDLADFGLQNGDAIDAIRYVNMTAVDRMEGPGLEQTPGSGILVAEGFVIPEDNGATSQVRPDPGPFASFPAYGNSTFDPDPLYFGVLHPLTLPGPLAGGNDVVGISTTTVTIATDGVARPTILYSEFNALDVRTRGGQDDVTVAMSAGLPTGGVSINGGDPSDNDRVTFTANGGQTITLSGSTASADGRTVTISNVEKVVVNTTAAGAGDTVIVDRSFALPGNSSKLEVVGGVGQTDRLIVDLGVPASVTADTVDLDADSVAVTNGITVDYRDVAQVELRTGDGADAVRVTPSTTTTYLINGGAPAIASNPGDRVTFELAGVANPELQITGVGAANFTSSSHAAIALVGIDSVGATLPLDVNVSAAANPVGGADTFSLVRNGAADEISVNGLLVFRIDRSAVDTLTVVGSGDDDELTLDYTAGDPIPAGGVVFLAGGQTTADRLRFVGPNIDTVLHRFDDPSTGATTIDGSTIEYSQVEGIVDLLAARRRNFTYTADDNYILIGDDAANAGRSLILSDHGPAASFVSPSVSMELKAGPRDDIVELWGLDATFTAELTIRGETGQDQIFIDDNGAGTAGGSVDWIKFPVFIDGGGQTEDTLIVEDSTSSRSKTYSISNVNIGGEAPPAGAAVDTPSASPTVDGTAAPGEWDDVPTAFDSGARPAPSLQTILHYNFSEANNANPGSTANDSTNNNLDGGLPVTPGPNFRETLGRFGGALDFNGSTDFAWFQDPTFNVGAEGSLSFWVLLRDVSRRNQIVEGPGNNGFEFQYLNSGAANGQFFGSPNNGADVAMQNPTARAAFQNTWTNVQFSWKKTSAAAGEMHIYINGTEVAYTAQNSTITSWNTALDTIDRFMTVGRDPVTGGRYLNGMLDDMAWFNKMLTGAELAQLSTQTVTSAQGALGGVFNTTALGGNLVAYWNLDDSVGTTVVAGDAGTTINLYTVPTSARFMPTGGRIGGALEFNSPESFATFQDAGFNVGAQGTLNFWIFQRDADRRNQIIEGPGDSGIEFQYRTSGSTNGQFYGSPNRSGVGNTEDFAIESAKVRSTFTGQWINMQYTWDFNTKVMRVYRNGVEVAYQSGFDQNIGTWNSVVNTVNGLFTVGRDPGAATPDRWLDGKLDDVAFFNKVLTPAERDSIRLNVGGVGGAQTALHGALDPTGLGGNLVAYWNLDDAVGTTTVAGDGGTNITLNLNVPAAPEGAQFINDGGPLLTGGTQLDSLQFDGNRDFIRTLDAPALDFNKSQGTIAFWVKPQDNSAAQTMASIVEDSNRQLSLGISWQTDAGSGLGNANLFGRVVFSPWENVPGASTNVIASNTQLTMGAWTHVAVTWDFATRTSTIYINGVADTTIVNTTANPAVWTQAAGNTGDFIFGGDGLAASRWFQGDLADVAIYGSALRASEVQTLVAEGAGAAGGFDLAGAKGKFTWDATNLYGLVESYPAGAGNSNGPFDNLEIELFINNGTTVAGRINAASLVPPNSSTGAAVAPVGNDVPRYEFSIPLSSIVDGGHTFDPNVDFLTYRLRTIDGDVASGGFDTRDTTLGWTVEPPLAANGYRQLDFAKSENFFGTGGRLNFTGLAHLTVNGGTGDDTVTIVDSQLPVPFTNPTKTFTVNAGGGNDSVTIASIDSEFRAAITIDGQAGTDTVAINAPLVLGSNLSTGALTVSAETINVTQPINTLAGGTFHVGGGNVTFHVGSQMTVAATADFTVGGNFLVDGAGTLTTGADVTTQGGSITVQTATTLTADVVLTSAGGNVSFDGGAATLKGTHDLTITAGTGDVKFAAAVGVGSPLVDVLINSADDVTINAEFNAATLTHLSGTGTTTFNGATNLTTGAGVTALDLSTPRVVVNAAVTTTGGDINIQTDVLDIHTLLGALDATAATGIVTIITHTNGRTIELGGNGAGRLALSDAELDRITAAILRIGDANSGPIVVSNVVDPVGTDVLHLTTGAGIAASGTGAIVETNLAIEAFGDVLLGQANNVDTLAINILNGAGSTIIFRDVDDLLLDDVDGVFDLVNFGGTTTFDVGAGLTQTIDGIIATGNLRLLGTGTFFLFNPFNDVNVLAADVDGLFLYVDFDDVTVGTVQTIAGVIPGDLGQTVGITTNNNPVAVEAIFGNLNLAALIDAGTSDVALISDFGAVDDVAVVGTKVRAGTLGIVADAGIGVTQALQTDVGVLAAENFTSGRIAIVDQGGGDLEIGDLGFAFGLLNLADGGISVVHTGAMTVTADVVSLGGTINLSTVADGGNDDHLVLEAPVIVVGGAGNIVLHGGTDLILRETGIQDDVEVTGDGELFGTAGRNVIIENNVRVRSATGAIENIPPLLSNLGGPQVSATGDATVTFDYGRAQELNFRVFVNWSDGAIDFYRLNPPGTFTAPHNFSGNPDASNPAAPITITVTLLSDDRIHFTGYEVTTLTTTIDVPGEGLSAKRIDTTPQVPHLVFPTPAPVTAAPPPTVVSFTNSLVIQSGGNMEEATDSEERVVILRVVLPSGKEGEAVRFPESQLDDLQAVFKKLRDGRYRIYLFEPDTQQLRLVMDVNIREGKPTAPGATSIIQGGPDGAAWTPPPQPDADLNIAEPVVAEAVDVEPDADESEATASLETDESGGSHGDATFAMAGMAAGASVVALPRTYADRIDRALAQMKHGIRRRGRTAGRSPRR